MMRGGRIVERGIHAKLIADEDGEYPRLMRSHRETEEQEGEKFEVRKDILEKL